MPSGRYNDPVDIPPMFAILGALASDAHVYLGVSLSKGVVTRSIEE
jgi:hypothetical protein